MVRLKNDHGKDFEDSDFSEFCSLNRIIHEFFAPRTPQKNGVVEKRNKVLQEMARVMLTSKKLAKNLWAKVMSTVCYIVNRVYVRPITRQNPHELYKGKKHTVKYWRVFGSTCYILKDREDLGKFDA